MPRTNIVELVQGVSSLATLSDVFVRISQLVEDQGSTNADLIAAISQDPSFTMRLLRVANSSYYGFFSTVDTVGKAVSIIGKDRIRNLALSTSVASSFPGLPNDLVSMDNFWRHSLYCALIARILAKQMPKCDPEGMFTAGLLHDIGELVIFSRLSAAAREVLQRVQDSADELPIHKAEWEIIGFDHAHVGGALAREWHLPPLLVECISCHHAVQEARDYPQEAALVNLANTLAQMAEVDMMSITDVSSNDPRAWEISGLGEDIIEPVVREAQEEFAEARNLFIGN